MYYIVFEEWGFLADMKGKCTRNIRYAHSFTDWDTAERVAITQGKGKAYVILSTHWR